MKNVETLYQDFIGGYPDDHSIYSALDIQSQILFQAHKESNPDVCTQISNWFPDLIGAETQEILDHNFNEDDARLTIALEYGFSTWDQVVTNKHVKLNRDFELAVNAVVNGELEKLRKILSKHSALINQKSQYGHKASLLIYTAANGIETWRQKTPPNIVEVTELLLDFGANIRDQAHVYGGQYDVKTLVSSSAHPAKLGVTDKLLSLLGHRD